MQGAPLSLRNNPLNSMYQIDLKRRLDILILYVLLAPLAKAGEPAAAEASATTPAKPKRQVVEVPLSTLDSYVSRYDLKPSEHLGGDIVTFFRDRGHLSVQFAEDETYELFPASPVR